MEREPRIKADRTEGCRKAKVGQLGINTHYSGASLKGLRHEPEHVSSGNPHSTKELKSFISVPSCSLARTLFYMLNLQKILSTTTELFDGRFFKVESLVTVKLLKKAASQYRDLYK